MNWTLLNEEKYFNGNIKSRTFGMEIIGHASTIVKEEAYNYSGEIVSISTVEISWSKIIFDTKNQVHKLIHLNNKDYDKKDDE